MATTYLGRGTDHLGGLSTFLRDLTGYGSLTRELIQNADDAQGATRLSFALENHALIVENDAQFSDCQNLELEECPGVSSQTRCDFHRFRRVLGGDKRDEEGTTGAFGVGFTSVYQIADHPELISSGRHWTLHDENPEGERIRQEMPCTCAQCVSLPLGSTRFILPWARDPNSIIRQRLRAAAVSPNVPERLWDELREHGADCMLFLRKLTEISTRFAGRQCAIRRGVDERTGAVILSVDGQMQRWHLCSGTFAAEAAALRAQFPDRIDQKKKSDVRVAFSDGLTSEGLLYAFLPTEHDLPLPIRCNADFFPSADRKRVHLGGDGYEARWNAAALAASARAVAESTTDICDLLGTTSWRLFGAAFEARNVPHFDVFWQELEDALRDSANVFVTGSTRVRPQDAVFATVSEAAEQLLRDIGLSLIATELRPYHNTLERLGTRPLDRSHITGTLARLGEQPIEVSSAPAPLRTSAGRHLLWEIIEGLRAGSDQGRLKHCSLVLCHDGRLWPCAKLRVADAETVSLFRGRGAHLGFAEATEAELPLRLSLCDAFSVWDAADLIRQSITANPPTAEDAVRWLDWFAVRQLEWRDKKDRLREALAKSPIFPTAGGLRALTAISMPGDFRDPIGVADIVELPGRADFLRELGIRQLSLRDFILTHLAPSLSAGRVPSEKFGQVVALLAEKLGSLRDDAVVRDALRQVPSVLCTDGKMRLPARVHFRTTVTESLLGRDEPMAFGTGAENELYRWLGVHEEPTYVAVVRRVHEIAGRSPTAASRDYVRKVIEHLGERLKSSQDLPTDLFELRTFAWLPARGASTEWFKRDDVCSVFSQSLFFSSGTFLDVPQSSQTGAANFLQLLGIRSEPTINEVVKHLLHCAEQDPPVKVSTQVYVFLQRAIAADGRWIARLPHRRVVLVEHSEGSFSYVDARSAFWSAHPFGRYATWLHPSFRDYHGLLSALGVRESPEADDARRVLLDISASAKSRGWAVSLDECAVVRACWTLLSTDPAGLTAAATLTKQRVIPNRSGVLSLPNQMFFEDRAGLAEPFGAYVINNLVDRSLDYEHGMLTTGVRWLSEAIEAQVESEELEDDPELAARIVARRGALGRVVAASDLAESSQRLDRMNRVTASCAPDLAVARTLRIGTRPKTVLRSEEAFASMAAETGAEIAYRGDSNSRPWAAIARELASIVAPGIDPGRLASGFRDVLSAYTIDDAHAALDALGFRPLQDSEPGPASPAPTRPVGSDAPPNQPDEAPTSPPGGERDQPADDGGFGEPGSLGDDGGLVEPRSSAGDGGVPQGSAPRGRNRPKAVLRSYLPPPSDGPSDPSVAPWRAEVEAKAMDLVRRAEKADERDAVDVSEDDVGFDFDSQDETGTTLRRIEVKGLRGDWNGYVKLTRNEFRTAYELGDLYWLYVVERVFEPDFQIHTIQNPARRVTDFLYDDGWAEFALDDKAAE